jgi:hypothetical protein
MKTKLGSLYKCSILFNNNNNKVKNSLLLNVNEVASVLVNHQCNYKQTPYQLNNINNNNNNNKNGSHQMVQVSDFSTSQILQVPNTFMSNFFL